MRKPAHFQRAVLALVLFGVSFGYVEAAVVVYLRAVSEPVRARALHREPDPSLAHLFPLLSAADLRGVQPIPLWRIFEVEIGREAATMVMLAALALAIGRSGAESIAAFVMAFGIWDIAFYAFLKLFIHWPASLLTWDLLFLLPVPWTGPVLAPVIVAASMIAAGWMALRRAWDGSPIGLSRIHWTGIFLGALIIVASFTWNYRDLLAGGVPHHFNWLMFSAGEACAVGAFLDALLRKERLQAPLASGSVVLKATQRGAAESDKL
ncbi:MAG: hypothetical protein ACRD3D_04095 [Terriglobia bacterium]